jgi:GNAT superfamily N-acetyltransferase
LGHVAVHCMNDNTAEIFRMAVCPLSRGMGITFLYVFMLLSFFQFCFAGVAHLLLEKATHFAASFNKRTLTLTTGSAMKNAINFYLSEGFKCVGRQVFDVNYLALSFERPIEKAFRKRW